MLISGNIISITNEMHSPFCEAPLAMSLCEIAAIFGSSVEVVVTDSGGLSKIDVTKCLISFAW